MGSSEYRARLKEYDELYTHGTEDDRGKNYMGQVNTYYDFATPFYEYAWGDSFHFAPGFKGDTHEQAMVRYEHSIAIRAKAWKGLRFLDLGSGIGGPSRNIARLTGVTILGVNNNEYQIKRAEELTSEAGLSDLITYKKCDFHDMQIFEQNSFDGCFSIEAIAHSPYKLKVYKSIYRLLKPGSYFVTAEWAITSKYDETNEEHRKIIKQIEKGNCLPHLERDSAILGYFKDTGFEVVEAMDLASPQSQNPWYTPLKPALGLKGILRSRPGRYFTHYVLKLFESVGLAKNGICDASSILMEGAEALISGGTLGIFTPMFLIWGRKPVEAE